MDKRGGIRWMSAAPPPQVLPASSRQAVDGMFRAINDARGFAAQAAQTLTARAHPPETSQNGSSGCNGSTGGRAERARWQVFALCTFAQKRLLLNGPDLRWSRRHRADCFEAPEPIRRPVFC